MFLAGYIGLTGFPLGIQRLRRFQVPEDRRTGAKTDPECPIEKLPCVQEIERAKLVYRWAQHDILDTYSPERMAFALKLVSSTDRAFGPLVHRGQWSKFLRTAVLPNALRILAHAPGIPKMIFRTISQTRITYRDSAFSEGRAGEIRGGDRLPWIGVLDNFKPLDAICWQLHVYGKTDAVLAEAAQGHGLKLVNFEFHDDAAEAGLANNGAYLVRPDGHIGLALPTQDAATLTDYLAGNGVTSGSAEN